MMQRWQVESLAQSQHVKLASSEEWRCSGFNQIQDKITSKVSVVVVMVGKDYESKAVRELMCAVHVMHFSISIT